MQIGAGTEWFELAGDNNDKKSVAPIGWQGMIDSYGQLGKSRDSGRR